MKVPPEITYRDVEKTDAVQTLVEEKLAKLERMCDYINGCHIAIEKTNDRPRSGSPYRVRIDLTIPPNHELVADCHPSEENQYVKLDAVIRDAFSKMETQIRKLTKQQREHEQSKDHNDATEVTALVTKVFHEDGYGFIKDLTGAEEVYFHRNSVLHDDFDRIQIGTGVRYSATDGDKGLQATSVQIVDKPGARAGKAEEQLVEPPLGWQS